MPKNPKIISVNLALDLIKETSFFNKRCANPWKFCEVKKNSHKNMVQQEKLPSMFAGSAGVELKSERRSFAKFTEKHLSWSLLLNKAAD